jgi:hypothetical protein
MKKCPNDPIRGKMKFTAILLILGLSFFPGLGRAQDAPAESLEKLPELRRILQEKKAAYLQKRRAHRQARIERANRKKDAQLTSEESR